jgi:hypothetical protein
VTRPRALCGLCSDVADRTILFAIFLLTILICDVPQWFNVLSALGEGVFGPVLALSAIALSATNQRLPLAAILVILAAVIYAAPFAAFFIAIMIYGF